MALIVNIARASDTTDPSFFRNKGRLIDRAVEEMFIYEASKPEYQRWIDTQIDRFKENKEVLQAFFPSFALQLYKDKKQHRFKLNDIPPQIPEKLYPYFYNIVEDVFKIKIPKRGGSGIEDLIKQVMLNWCPIVEKMGSISQTPREYIRVQDKNTGKPITIHIINCPKLRQPTGNAMVISNHANVKKYKEEGHKWMRLN